MSVSAATPAVCRETHNGTAADSPPDQAEDWRPLM
jgi:hypothetical protein